MDRIGILIKKASLELEKTALSVLLPYDMTLAQYKIIVYLYSSPPMSTRQVDLERAFSMTNPSVTSVLNTLEKKDLICRTENAEDRRSKVISLTQKRLICVMSLMPPESGWRKRLPRICHPLSAAK